MKRSAVKVSLASLMALAVLAVPATASALVWGPAGTTQSLDSTNSASRGAAWGAGWNCEKQHLGLKVRNPASSTLDVTAAAFTNCYGTGFFAGCILTETATGLPWTAQALALTNVTINVPNVNVVFSGGASCFYNGLETHFSGTLSAGVWNAAAHSLTHFEAPGLTLAGFGFGAYKATGTYKDPAGLLTLS